MKEKETIINGIDVSECDFYNDCECDAYRHEYWEPQDNTKDMCKEHDNCYFKQLKRLQEENEGLKSLNDFNVQKIEVLQEENEELKELKCKFKEYCTCDIEKYRSALEEIRNIAEKLITETPEYNSCYYKDECGYNCTPKKQGKVEYCCYENVDKILTITNEVLNDRD